MEPGADAEVVAHLLTFVEQTAEFVGVSDPWGRILYLNPAAQKRLGVVDVDGLSLADLFPPEAFGFYYDVVRPELLRTGAWSGEVLVNAAGGGPIPMHVSTIAKLGPGGETNGGVVFAHEVAAGDPVDITTEADVDDVTGVLQRSAFEDRVRHALATAGRERGSCALVVAEVGNAGGTTVGSAALDEVSAPHVLRALGGRMLRRARTIDIAGRVGEQRLGLFLRGVRGHGEALRIAQMMQESLADPPITTPGGTVAVAISCGVAISEFGDDPVAMIERALAAMTPDASMPAPVAVADDEPRRSGVMLSMDDFRVAMSHGHIVPYARPVVDLSTKHVVGYRGCARWNHPQSGLLNAESFVELIADSPLANEVDLFVARETAAVLLLATRQRAPRLYVPVSKRLIEDVRTEQYLSEIADAYFLSMSQIFLQIARPLLEHWTPAFEDALQSLRDAGVGFVLTGVARATEVEYPADQGFQEVHISRRLVQSVVTAPDSKNVIAEIVIRAHELGILAAASGVDEHEIERTLVASGCDLATGDVFGQLEPTKSIEGPARFDQ